MYAFLLPMYTNRSSSLSTAITDIPSLDLPTIQSLGCDHLRITGEHINSLITPFNLFSCPIFQIKNNALDGFLT
jgi:hypothetical protein